MIKEETIKRFKDTVKRLMKKTDYNTSGSPFDILVLDIREKKDRIEFCGYEKMVKLQFGDSLPFIGSPIKVIVRVPFKNRAVLAGKPGPYPVDMDKDPIAHYEGDVFLMYSNNAFMSKPVLGGKGFKPVNIFSLELPVEMLKDEILDARLKHDLEQICTWGLMPIEYEIIPEIDGVPPETIRPNKTAYLEKIIDKISRTAILTEKDIR